MTRRAFDSAARQLAEIGRRFYARGWVLGTSGNFSAVVGRKPLRLAITASAVPKGGLTRTDILQCDDRGRVRPLAQGGAEDTGDRPAHGITPMRPAYREAERHP